MEKAISVLEDKVYKAYFNEDARYEVFVLNATTASKLWEDRISKDKNSYFRLLSSHWLFTSKFKIVNNWIHDFGKNEIANLKHELLSEINRNENESIFFIINKSNILKTTWGYFTNHWIDFLFAGDDCPILISENGNEVIIFESNGNVKIVYDIHFLGVAVNESIFIT